VDEDELLYKEQYAAAQAAEQQQRALSRASAEAAAAEEADLLSGLEPRSPEAPAVEAEAAVLERQASGAAVGPGAQHAEQQPEQQQQGQKQGQQQQQQGHQSEQQQQGKKKKKRGGKKRKRAASEDVGGRGTEAAVAAAGEDGQMLYGNLVQMALERPLRDDLAGSFSVSGGGGAGAVVSYLSS